MARRVFSKEFKAETVALVLERGLSASRVSRDLGVGQPTISRWVKAAEDAAAPGALSSTHLFPHHRASRRGATTP